MKLHECRAAMPIASLESVMGRQSLLPFLSAECVDVCIVDPLWNGVDESCKMAALCDAFEVNCAAHNYHGWLGTAICAHFGAAIPNFKVLYFASSNVRRFIGSDILK